MKMTSLSLWISWLLWDKAEARVEDEATAATCWQVGIQNSRWRKTPPLKIVLKHVLNIIGNHQQSKKYLAKFCHFYLKFKSFVAFIVGLNATPIKLNSMNSIS